MSVVAAIGIGGTHFHFAAGTPDGHLRTAIETEPTRPEELCEQVVAAVEELNRRLHEEIGTIAVACRGLVDQEHGLIELMEITGGPRIQDLSLRQQIREQLGMSLSLENDCTAAALAEYYFGAGHGYNSIVHVTIGTGIGAGIVDHGHIVRGESNFAGEVGGIPVEDRNGRAWCGIDGAWEAHCSGPGIAGSVERWLADEERNTPLTALAPEELDAPRIFSIAKDGDTVACEYLDHVSRANAEALGMIANLFDPGLITLGGGVALNNGEIILDGIERHIEDYVVGERPLIQLTEIENMGIRGALAQVRHQRTRGIESVATIQD